MCEFDGEVTLGNRNYKYINYPKFTRYYWYNHTAECWCGYISIPEKVYNQLDEYYAGNTFLGILGGYDDYYLVIGNDDCSFNRLQAKLDYMEEQLLEDYGNILRNE